MNVWTSKDKPARIDKEWWRSRFGEHFPDLLRKEKDNLLEVCIDEVYTMWVGIADIWKHLNRVDYVSKTQLCYGLLVAWYIADLYPEYAVGVLSTGGIPIKSKKIGGVQIQYGEMSNSKGIPVDILQSLKSNVFGAKAYMMIKSSRKVLYIK